MGTRRRLLFVSNLFPDVASPYRGLDNATVLHELKDEWEITVLALRPSLKAWIAGGARHLAARPIDGDFDVKFIPIKYLPKIGGMMNHHLAWQALNTWATFMESQQRFDVVLASWLYPDCWAAARLSERLNTALVSIAQGSDVHRYLKSSLRRAPILDAVSRSKSVITRSRSLAVQLEGAGARLSHLTPIHNGVDTRVFHYRSQREARQRLNLQKGTKLLLFVGNLLPVKRPALLLEALAVARNPQIHLAMVGAGPLLKSLRATADTLGITDRVTFTGPLLAPQIAEWMNAADLLCMTSSNEGLPNVVLEAMACGLPVLATDVGGIHEIVDEPWKGQLVSGSNVRASFAGHITDMLGAPTDRERIAAYGATLSWHTTRNHYHQTLLNALKPEVPLADKSVQPAY